MDYDLFNELVEEIDIMLPIYPFSKPHVYFVDWRNCIMKLATDGEYYNIFTSMLKKYIIQKKIKISINLVKYPLLPYNPDNLPNDNWLVTM